jgi:hypothetical protein
MNCRVSGSAHHCADNKLERGGFSVRPVSLHGRGQAPQEMIRRVGACPLQQLQKTQGGLGVLPYLPRDQGVTLPASEDVTAVTNLIFDIPSFFGRPRNRNSNTQSRSPLGGSCAQIKQDCAGCCADRKQNCSCPCDRASSGREPWSRFALGLFFVWF